jgi:hypothetical protein
MTLRFRSLARSAVFSASLKRFAAAGLTLLASLQAACAATARVPYVPTPQAVVEKMLEVAKVGPRDFVIDLGSGDGRIVITAAKRHGARGFGVDLNPDRVREGTEHARNAGVADRVSFYQQDLYQTDLGQATVITMYLLPSVNLDLRPRLLQLAPGTRVVSHDFHMGDWKPDAHLTLDVKDKYGDFGGTSEVYFWVVPARVAGAWQWQLTVGGKPRAYEVRLDQQYQMLSGSARVGDRAVPLQAARLSGAEVGFAFVADIDGTPVRHEFVGRVDGEAIHGTATLSGARVQAQLEWNARRLPAAAAGAPAPRGVYLSQPHGGIR